MTVELLQTLSLVSYIAAGALFLTGIALFFLLDIPRVFGDVTGRTARKAIENIRQQNEVTGNKAYKPSPVNASRGKLTDKMTPSGKLIKPGESLGGAPGTEKFNTSKLAQQSGETTVLDETVVAEAAIPSAFPNGQQTAENAYVQQGTVQAIANDGLSVDVEMGFLGSTEIID